MLLLQYWQGCAQLWTGGRLLAPGKESQRKKIFHRLDVCLGTLVYLVDVLVPCSNRILLDARDRIFHFYTGLPHIYIYLLKVPVHCNHSGVQDSGSLFQTATPLTISKALHCLLSRARTAGPT